MTINLSVKNVSSNIVECIRERAKRHHRSLQGELLAILEETLTPRLLSLEEASQRIKKLPFQSESDSVKMIREDRDAR